MKEILTKMTKRIYMDHAAVTPADREVLEYMNDVAGVFGNPSSLHDRGVEARSLLEQSRESVASVIGAERSEIVFTSGGTESENLAIKGFALANRSRGNHIVMSAIEHPATMRAAEYLKKHGFSVTKLPVDKNGLIDLDGLESAITNKTLMVSVMHANHEIGVIQPIKEIASIAKKHGVAFHTNAVQSVGILPIDVNIGIDLLSISGHKVYGPGGTGALFVRKGIRLEPQIVGGEQEYGLRGATENVAGAAGLAKALGISRKIMKKEAKRLALLRDMLTKKILSIDDSWLNGHSTKRLPGIASFGFSYIEGESLILMLDMKGVEASTGSACSSSLLEASHVLTSLGQTAEEAHGSLRLCLGRENTKEDVRYVSDILPGIVEELRRLSPMTTMSREEHDKLAKSIHKH